MESTPSWTCTPHLADRTLTGMPTMAAISPTVSNLRTTRAIRNAKLISLSVWNHKDFQDRVLWLWGELAKHYKDNKWIAGYNPLNEPTDSKHTRLITFYNNVYKVIRAADPDHALFFDANTFASDFSHFGDAHKNWDNTGYSIHDYTSFGFPASPQEYVGSDEQKRRLYRSYEKKREWIDERGLYVWNGEWGPVYARKPYDGDATESINRRRYHVLKDQLDIYNKVISQSDLQCTLKPSAQIHSQDKLSWSIWLYKDIGFQGMVYISPSTAYMQRFAKFLAKKHRLAVDAWGADDTAVRHIYEPLQELVATEIDEKYRDLYPGPVWKVNERITRISRNILISEFLVQEWADHFVGLDEQELDELAASFKYSNCVKREELNTILTENAKAVQ